ncbi:hypothetical protein NKR23_g7024 [Pleurostoma richardsiae]|uniref:Microsomal glutathione S-transferase 3 n=1 Tax=Pleurostoma richardsiae TaxID=41990 RepID=A0AA38RMX2_9PEZI|nr:hypothetical protein NKR23_g7024 [Pleurostoma richardsiae]
MPSIEIPSEYGYVLLAATSTFFVNTYHMILTSQARKKSGILYPAAYASNEVAEKDPKAYAFNCAQRAHANYTENLTPFLGSLLISGLRYPLLAAGIGGAWALSRVIYAYGYVKSGPKGRTRGSGGSFLCDTTMKFMALYTSVMFVLGK